MLVTYSYNKRARQFGLSIVELLVALALGATLTAGISGVYLENKRNFAQDEEMARMQENGRFAINLLKREVKMAGFFGGVEPPMPDYVNGDLDTIAVGGRCVTGGQWTLDTTFPIDFINDYSGSNATVGGATLLDSCLGGGDLEPGTDVLVLKRTADRPTISDAKYDTNPQLVIGDEKTKSWYLEILNTGGVVTAGSVQFTYVNTAFDPAVTVANSSIDMWLYQTHVFYIRDYSITPGDKIPTLMVATLDGEGYVQEALVEGVEAFHVEFGLENAAADNAVPVRFVQNPTNAQLPLVSVVRIYMLLRTREEIPGYTDDKSYVLGSKNIATADLYHGDTTINNPNDRDYRRRVFTTTIKVRNI